MATKRVTTCDKCDEIITTLDPQKIYVRGYATWTLCMTCTNDLIGFIEDE